MRSIYETLLWHTALLRPRVMQLRWLLLKEELLRHLRLAALLEMSAADREAQEALVDAEDWLKVLAAVTSSGVETTSRATSTSHLPRSASRTAS